MLKLTLRDLSGLEENLLKTFQFFHRTGDAAHQVADVKLNHLRSVTAAGIGDGNSRRQFAISTHLRAAQVNITVGKKSYKIIRSQTDRAARCSRRGNCCGTFQTNVPLATDARCFYDCRTMESGLHFAEK